MRNKKGYRIRGEKALEKANAFFFCCRVVNAVGVKRIELHIKKNKFRQVVLSKIGGASYN